MTHPQPDTRCDRWTFSIDRTHGYLLGGSVEHADSGRPEPFTAAELRTLSARLLKHADTLEREEKAVAARASA